MRIKVLIGDTHLLFAHALGIALHQYRDLTVTADYPTTGVETIAAVARRSPHVALLDYWLPDIEGPPLIALLKARMPALSIVTLAWFYTPQDAGRALAAGADAFLGKDATVRDVYESVLRVHATQAADNSDGRSALEQVGPRIDLTPRRFAALTPREIEVLDLVAGGLPVEKIAARLRISLPTVRNHIRRALNKTGAHTHIEAVAIARQHGLFTR